MIKLYYHRARANKQGRTFSILTTIEEVVNKKAKSR